MNMEKPSVEGQFRSTAKEIVKKFVRGAVGVVVGAGLIVGGLAAGYQHDAANNQWKYTTSSSTSHYEVQAKTVSAPEKGTNFVEAVVVRKDNGRTEVLTVVDSRLTDKLNNSVKTGKSVMTEVCKEKIKVPFAAEKTKRTAWINSSLTK